MIKALFDSPSSAVVVGVDFLRWFVGMSYEQPQEDVLMFVFRFGPLYLHIIHRIDV